MPISDCYISKLDSSAGVLTVGQFSLNTIATKANVGLSAGSILIFNKMGLQSTDPHAFRCDVGRAVLLTYSMLQTFNGVKPDVVLAASATTKNDALQLTYALSANTTIAAKATAAAQALDPKVFLKTTSIVVDPKAVVSGGFPPKFLSSPVNSTILGVSVSGASAFVLAITKVETCTAKCTVSPVSLYGNFVASEIASKASTTFSSNGLVVSARLSVASTAAKCDAQAQAISTGIFSTVVVAAKATAGADLLRVPIVYKEKELDIATSLQIDKNLNLTVQYVLGSSLSVSCLSRLNVARLNSQIGLFANTATSGVSLALASNFPNLIGPVLLANASTAQAKLNAESQTLLKLMGLGQITASLSNTSSLSFGVAILSTGAVKISAAATVSGVLEGETLTFGLSNPVLATGGQIGVRYPFTTASIVASLNSSSTAINAKVALTAAASPSLGLVGYLTESALMPATIAIKATSSADYVRVPWVESKVYVTSSLAVEPIRDSNFIVSRRVVLADAGSLAVYVTLSQSAASVGLTLSNLFLTSQSVALQAALNNSRLEIPMRTSSVTAAASLLDVSVSLKTLKLATDVSTFVKGSLNLVGQLEGNTFLSTAFATAKAEAYSFPIRFSPLNLGQPSLAAKANTVPIPNDKIVITGLRQLPSATVVQAKCAATAFFATNLATIDYPIVVHEQVRYPIGTASSYASPLINDVPVFYSHGVFGAAITNVDPGSVGSASLSALLRTELALNPGDSYAANSVQASSMLVLFRVSASDTSTVSRSAFGTGNIGADLTRFSSSSTGMPLAYTGSVTQIGSGGTTLLGAGNQFVDGRTINTASQNGRFFVASSLIRHNYKSADSTTVPLSVATDFNYPTTNATRLSRARLETTVKADDEIGLSPIYSTVHMGMVSDSEFQARYSSAAPFSLNAASVGSTTAAATQHIHSSDSMFAFLPMKLGVKYQFNKNYAPLAGSYTVASAQFVNVSGQFKFVVSLVSSTGAPVNSNSIPGNLKLRIKINSYRADDNRFVFIDVPIAERYNNDFVVDSAYRWFVQSVAAGTGTFYDQAEITLARDEAYATWSTASNATLIVTRPNMTIGSLPASEQGGGDQGESAQYVLSTTNDRNLLIGEFSLGISRNASAVEASARVSISPTTSVETYDAGNPANTPANSVSAADPEVVQLIIDQAGNLKGSVRRYVSGQYTTTSDLNSILPNAVKVFIAANGKFSKVVVGHNNIGLLTVPASGTSGRKLFLWGTNVYGQLIPPDDINANTYETFLKEGYIDNVLDFDIGLAYVCIITDAGNLRCWGCNRAMQFQYLGESPWVAGSGSTKMEQSAIGGRHMLLKTASPTAGESRIRQYGNLAQNIPYTDGWAPDPTTTATSYDFKLVACGAEHAVAIRANGTIACWGDNTQGQCTIPASLSGEVIVEVAAGDYHTVAMDAKGNVYAWGRNVEGQTNIGSVVGLKAKSVFAGGNYSGAIRRSTATDVSATPGIAYSDVEDTLLITGDNSRYVTNVPLCEGMSYDPSYPRCRMKFHKVVAGWDHVIGIRKVESDLAHIIHPELCRFVNNNNILVRLLTSTNAVIFSDVTSSNVLFSDPDANGSTYHPNQIGIAIGSVSYRLKNVSQNEGGSSFCPSGRVLQRKPSAGSWTDVKFRITSYDSYGAVSVTDDEVTGINRIKPVWFGATNTLPYWAVGINTANFCGTAYEYNHNILSASQAVGATGEKFDLNFSAADAYLNSNTNESLVCWGNPIAYYTGYLKSDYVNNYGVPSNELYGNTSDITAITPYITQSTANTRFVGVGNDSYKTIANYYPVNQTCSYVGRLSFANAVNGILNNSNSIYGPLVPDTSTGELYLGPVSAYLIPSGQVFGGLYTPMIVRTSLTGNANPEVCILNAVLPVEGYKGTAPPSTNAYYSWYNSPVDIGIELHSSLGIAQGAIKSLLPSDSATLLQPNYASTDKWIVMADVDAALSSYGWGSSPTGYWYVYNNNSNSVGGVTAGLQARYYNLTGICAYTSEENDSALDEARLPYESSLHQSLTSTQLAAIGLGIRRFHVVKHMTDKSWSMAQPKLMVKAGKHLSMLPIGPTATTSFATKGVLVRSNDSQSNLLGWLPMTSSEFGVDFFELGYRSIYVLQKQSMLLFIPPGSYYGLSEAFPQGDNLHGQLTTPEYYGKFSRYPAFGPAGGQTPPILSSSWFMNVGQLAPPSVAAGQTFTKVSCGQYHTLALDTRGKVYAWGSNSRMTSSVSSVTDWNPSMCIGWSDAPCNPPQQWYSATKDIFEYTPPQYPNWWNNYVSSGFWGGVPASLRQQAPYFLPYPTSLTPGADDGTFNSNSATLWSGGDIGPVAFSQAGFKGSYSGSLFTNFRNGGFSIKVVQDANGKRFELATGLNEPKLYSSYFSTGSAGLRLLSWTYTYDGGVKFTARVNGAPITWGPNPEDVVSPALTSRNPRNATQIIGTSTVPNESLKDVCGLSIEGVVAGRNFKGIIHSSSISGNPSKYLKQTNNGSIINYEVEPKGFEDISIGSFAGFTDLVLQKVIRRFNVIGNSTYSGGSIYAGATPTIAKYFETQYKIYIKDDIAYGDKVKYTDLTPPVGGALIWPQVVLPGDVNYNSPYAYHPKDIGLFRYPNVTYPDTDTFDIVSIRDRVANPEPPFDGQVFDIDQVSMYYFGGDLLGQYVVYDSATKRLLPQRYTPNANSVPATVCNNVMAWADAGFAVSADKLHSWGKNRDKTRSYNDTSYDIKSANIPPGVTSITCPSKSSTYFRGAVLVGSSPNSTMFVWGNYSEYTKYWEQIWPAAGNQVHTNFTYAQGSTPFTGFKKIVVADVGYSGKDWFYGIDSLNKIKLFKVEATAISDDTDPFNPKRYLKYVEYDPSDPMQQLDSMSDYAVPAEVASLDIADVEMAPNAVVVRTTAGKVFCWGQSAGYSDIAYNFNDQCHECAADYNTSTEPSVANPSPKTKLNSTSTNPVVDIAVSQSHAAALRSDGSVLIWGVNSPYTIAGGYASQFQVNNPFKTATPTNKPMKMGSNRIALAVIRNDGSVQVWLNDSYDTYGLIPATTINLGGFASAKLTKNSSALNFIALNNSGGLSAWGAGGLGAQSDPNYGQSAIPRNLFDASPWDTQNAQYRQAVVVTPVSVNASNSNKIMVTHKNVSANLAIPLTIKAISDDNPVTATDIQSFLNVVDIAAGKNVMFAITNAAYGATSGSIVKWGVNSVAVPTGSNWSKIASSHTQNSIVGWSHAAALDSSGNLRLWGVDPYWTTNQNPAGSYKAITCTNHAVIATKTDNTLAVFERIPDGSTVSSVALPGYLQNVTFKQVSGGENHVVATVLAPVSISTPNGLFELNANDVVAWGDNSSQQCDIPGYAYASPDNLPVQSDYVAAGYDFSVYNRVATGITHPVLENFALSFQTGFESSIERAEGYMIHSTGSLCDFILPESHDYYFNRPTYSLERSSINFEGHKAQSGWTTNATAVPSDFLPTSSSPRKAKLVCADRFKAWTRTASTRDYQWGAGYSVIVEEGNTDSVVVFGGEQLMTGCPTPFVTPGSIAIRQIPVLENGTKISTIQSHRGYLYALDSSGAISPWGYIGSSTNYFSLSNDSFSLFKRSLSIPRTGLADSDIKYSIGGGTSIAASYVTGVPDLSPSWAVDVSINRYYNGQKTTLKRYAAAGSTDKVDISQGVNFAQGFMALDVWPGLPSALDTYYTMDVNLAGGGVRYKVNSASLMTMNLDSKNTVGTKILKEATASTDQGVADFAIVANTKYLGGRVPTQAGSVSFDNVIESQSGFTLDYNSDVSYPAYLRNSFGSSAKIELIDTVNQSLFLQGRIAETSQGIGWTGFQQNWATAGIAPQAGGATTPVTSWLSTTQSSLAPITTGGILAPYLVNPFATGKLGIKLRSQSTTTASRLLNPNPNVVMGAFTYFVVKRNVSDTTGATSPNTPYVPHSIFGAVQRVGTSAYAQGIGENGRKPGVVFTDNNLVFCWQTSTQSVVVNQIQIVNAYFGSASDLGIRLNGQEQTLAASATSVTMASNLQNGYYLGAPLFTTGVREQNTEIAEVIVFNRRLSLAEMEFVEGYLAWAFGIQSSLPATHPYKNSAPIRGELTAIKPFADDAAPDQFFDIGLAANNRAETWLTLYDVTAEYRASRINAGVVRDEHAPLIVELELDKQQALGFLTTTTAIRCRASAGILELTGKLPFGSASAKLATLNTPDTFTVIRNDAIALAKIENKLEVVAALTLAPLQLKANALNLKLKFMAGVNCGGPYGCTDIEDRDPDLTITSNIPDYNPVSIFTNFRVLDAALGANIKFRYIKVDCVFNCFGNLSMISSISGSTDARLSASATSLKFGYENIASAGGSIVQVKANVKICDANGFIIKKPKYTNPTNPPLFPTVDRPGSVASGQINFGNNLL